MTVTLACGHDEALATLHRDGTTAWCPVCEADVGLTGPGQVRTTPWIGGIHE